MRIISINAACPAILSKSNENAQAHRYLRIPSKFSGLGKHACYLLAVVVVGLLPAQAISSSVDINRGFEATSPFITADGRFPVEDSVSDPTETYRLFSPEPVGAFFDPHSLAGNRGELGKIWDRTEYIYTNGGASNQDFQIERVLLHVGEILWGKSRFHFDLAGFNNLKRGYVDTFKMQSPLWLIPSPQH